MTLVKWEPFRELMAMQDRMTRLFDETLSRIWKEDVGTGRWSPPVDIIERKGEILLKIDLPEVVQNEIDIRVEENTLVVEGERRLMKEAPDDNYLQVERPYGAFRRTFTIPRTIEYEKITASYRDGVLRIVLPKRPETHPKRVVIEDQ